MINFKFRKTIKIPEKSFNDLSLYEVALMIEADSSLSEDGNEYFDSSALDVFLHNSSGLRPDLEKIRNELLSEIYISVPGHKNKIINTDFLINYAKLLKAEMG